MMERHEIVVRYQGGANAGHTVVIDGKKFKLSLIPSGIFRENVTCVIAGGVVLNPPSLLEEIDRLQSEGFRVENNLMISDRAHVIFPWHIAEDRIFDNLAGDEAIGTTMRGIGPCYRDKVGRSLAIRFGDLFRPGLKERIATIAEVKNRFLDGLSHGIDHSMGLQGWDAEIEPDSIYENYMRYAERLRPCVADTTAFLLDAVDADKQILFEGAQGSLLDIDHGTFPFVTSSNSSGVGIAAGSGVPPRFITEMIGVVKAYTTRVGGGPFPTEQDNAIGQKIRDQGNEYGTVTKRPRRCGWFDAVATRYTVRLGGIDTLAVMLLDVLSGFETLQICTAYDIDGKETTEFPSDIGALRRAKPVLETVPGWNEDITGVRRFGDLPPNAQHYVKRLGELLTCPVGLVSVGPDRAQTIQADRS